MRKKSNNTYIHHQVFKIEILIAVSSSIQNRDFNYSMILLYICDQNKILRYLNKTIKDCLQLPGSFCVHEFSLNKG